MRSTANKTLLFVPIFSPIGRIMTNCLSGQRSLYHTAIDTLPFPTDSFQFIVFFQSDCPYSFEKSCICPCLEITMDTTAGAKFFWKGLPLATSSQDIEDTL